jgi:hypothetical protein
MARLGALVRGPRVYLTRFHGVFAPNYRRQSAVGGSIRRS